jgi:hypothetical protein
MTVSQLIENLRTFAVTPRCLSLRIEEYLHLRCGRDNGYVWLL